MLLHKAFTMMYQKLNVTSKLHHIIIDKIKLVLLFKALTLMYHKDRHFFRIFFYINTLQTP